MEHLIEDFGELRLGEMKVEANRRTGRIVVELVDGDGSGMLTSLTPGEALNIVLKLIGCLHRLEGEGCGS